MPIQHHNPATVFALPIYTQMVTVTDMTMIYLTGQVAWDRTGTVIGEGDLRTQAVQAFENIQALLAAVNADFTHVVKLTTYIKDFQPEHRAIFVDVLGQYIGDSPPAHTLLGVQLLARPELLIEIEVIAAIPR